MADPVLFDFAENPNATIRYTAVRFLGGKRYEVDGVLTVMGIERDVTMPFTWTSAGDGAVLEGRTKFHCLDFDIATGEWADVPRWAFR